MNKFKFAQQLMLTHNITPKVALARAEELLNLSNETSKDQSLSNQDTFSYLVTKETKNGITGVRVQGLGEDLFVYPKDFENGQEMKWDDVMNKLKENGLTTFAKKQAYLLLYLKDEINEVLKEIGGDELTGYYWSSTEYSSDIAWGVNFGDGNLNGNFNRCYSLVVRAVAAF